MKIEQRAMQSAIECYFYELDKLFKSSGGFEMDPMYDDFIKCFKSDSSNSSKLRRMLSRNKSKPLS